LPGHWPQTGLRRGIEDIRNREPTSREASVRCGLCTQCYAPLHGLNDFCDDRPTPSGTHEGRRFEPA